MSTDSDGSHDDGGNEEFERLVQAVKRELKNDGFGGGPNLISRRGALAGLLGVGSAVSLTTMTGNVEAAGEDFGNASGTVGTDAQPLQEINVANAHTDALTAVSFNGGGPVSDGDGSERQIWVIANGASDPSGADAEDIIFEEES